ncbi:hypothetical protein BSL78_24652 [Apostichopus japonicus]|uniref:Reverse transcriptase domain-containing protein n=1 Tax=Stichopus japonicus TaxID=307972 RepID=A0A2G8JS57_STIJA|nr:hypothetical protein BSL78_24652 [Apostichopus japonicus]
MPDIVGPLQTCAVRGKCIQHNLWLMRDLIEFVKVRDLPCALVSLDQEKAFDMDLASFKSLSKVLATSKRLLVPDLTIQDQKAALRGWRGQSLPFDATWSDVMIRVNGIWLGYGAPEATTWAEKADQVEARLDTFSRRWLSLPGKVTVVNRFIVPLLWYPGTVIAAPDHALEIGEDHF